MSGAEAQPSGSRAGGLLESAVGIVTEPVPTLRRLTHEPRVAWAVVVTIVLALASALAGAARVDPDPIGVDPRFMGDDLRAALLPVSLVVGPLFAVLALAMLAGIVQGSSYVLGGRGSYAGMFVGLAFANIPSLLRIPAQLLPLALGSAGAAVAGIVGLAISIWVVVLGVVAVRENHGFSTARAIAAAVVPFVLLVGLIVLVLLAAAIQVVGSIS